MMKKMERIKNLDQLRDERSKLLQRKAELEKTIQQDWVHLKDELKPGHAAREWYRELSSCHSNKRRGFIASLFSLCANRYKKR
jgi:hypothetical protein